jgi:hypothetical protein
VSFAFSIDIGAMASRVLGVELRDQTLATLATLPLTTRQIVYRKALACVLAVAPAAIFTIIFQILSLKTLFAAQSMMAKIAPLGLMMSVQLGSAWVQKFLLIHVIAWLSLFMKRGALPVGYMLTYALGVLVTTVFAAIGFARSVATMSVSTSSSSVSVSGSLNGMPLIYWAPVFASLVSIVAIWLLHRHSLRRLETLAGES